MACCQPAHRWHSEGLLASSPVAAQHLVAPLGAHSHGGRAHSLRTGTMQSAPWLEQGLVPAPPTGQAACSSFKGREMQKDSLQVWGQKF